MGKLPYNPASFDDGISRYLRHIRKFERLSPERERQLAVRWQCQRDHAAFNGLINSHLRFVAHVAFKHRGYGVPVSELISEGNLGLVKAVMRFEPDHGVRLSTYAIWWIRTSIYDFIVKAQSLVNAGSVSLKKAMFLSNRRAKARIQELHAGNMTSEDQRGLARDLRISERNLSMSNSAFGFRDLSLNAPVSNESSNQELIETLPAKGQTPEEVLSSREERRLLRDTLEKVLRRLPARERDIFTARRLMDEPIPLRVLGADHGISIERVRQLEFRTLFKVQEAVKNSQLQSYSILSGKAVKVQQRGLPKIGRGEC